MFPYCNRIVQYNKGCLPGIAWVWERLLPSFISIVPDLLLYYEDVAHLLLFFTE